MTARLTASGRCSECGKLQVRFDTDLLTGRLLEIPAPCRCMVRARSLAAVKRVARRPAWRQRIDNDRRRACVCQLCGLPVVGKPKVALYCEAHRAERRRETQVENRKQKMREYSRRWRERNRETIRKRERARARRDREKRAEYKRQWRKLNRDKTRAQKQRSALRNFRTSGAPVKRWREQVATGERQPQTARRNRKGERLCLTAGCYSVMVGMAKKCDRCKRREARAAVEALGLAA